MAYFWCNQSYQDDITNNIGNIQCPLVDAAGKNRFLYDSIGLVLSGDIIFGYDSSNQAILRVGIALGTVRLTGTTPQRREVQVLYKTLINSIPKSSINPTYAQGHYLPFNMDGNIKEGYLFPISDNAGAYLLSLIH